MDFMGMGLQPVGMGLKLMGMGWGWGNFCGDGADVQYRVTLYLKHQHQLSTQVLFLFNIHRSAEITGLK